mmetsp:Transcript_176384/g.565545  ORF Transcript_176384/g.565545 Transcript_176384/m.565545 type:complete len:321 (+) Transcript_176384:3529-4491(+)
MQHPMLFQQLRADRGNDLAPGSELHAQGHGGLAGQEEGVRLLQAAVGVEQPLVLLVLHARAHHDLAPAGKGDAQAGVHFPHEERRVDLLQPEVGLQQHGVLLALAARADEGVAPSGEGDPDGSLIHARQSQCVRLLEPPICAQQPLGLHGLHARSVHVLPVLLLHALHLRPPSCKAVEDEGLSACRSGKNLPTRIANALLTFATCEERILPEGSESDTQGRLVQARPNQRSIGLLQPHVGPKEPLLLHPLRAGADPDLAPTGEGHAQVSVHLADEEGRIDLLQPTVGVQQQAVLPMLVVCCDEHISPGGEAHAQGGLLQG